MSARPLRLAAYAAVLCSLAGCGHLLSWDVEHKLQHPWFQEHWLLPIISGALLFIGIGQITMRFGLRGHQGCLLFLTQLPATLLLLAGLVNCPWATHNRTLLFLVVVPLLILVLLVLALGVYILTDLLADRKRDH